MSKKPKILYVEDDIYLSFVTKDNLEIKGYDIDWQKDGEAAIQAFSEHEFDLCILDIMLPKLDGFSVAEAIRKENQDIPILFLSAKTLKEDRIKGLTIGADDYITKPFSIEELVLKIEVFLKRNKVKKVETQSSIAELGKFYFDFENLELSENNNAQRLTLREAELLHLFCQNKNKLLKKEDILNTLWKDDSYFLSRSLDVFVSRLRKLLKKDPRLNIENIHGVGFIFKVET
ncbi:response regulator transcription factor [Lentimicrobium sp. S6]|uniref:response regulator transcription factor n=1 Tax=Lentimicrobium sp. S6 TaxID=2735872 RepID=UPI0015546448|nr:response regulator transcription factor [Lentimicrobium sp. S6]NPD47091.1 response regulator transcription factor [Lentimicrobium sp. S6]